VVAPDIWAVSPAARFYQTYSVTHVGAIVDALARRAEFPFELTYLGGGSELWRATEGRSATPAARARRDAVDALPERHADQVMALVPPAAPVQVVDLGPGTARPILGLLRHLLDRSRLAGYRAIDISPEMLGLARQGLRACFPGHADGFELHCGDFAGPDLDRVLTGDRGPVRLVVLAGGTLHNLADPDGLLRRLGRAMSADDLLLLTLRLDNGVDRPPFMEQVGVDHPVPPQQLSGMEMLNVDRSWYQTETGYDRDRSEVFIRARFLRPVAVVFDVGGAGRTVSFATGDTVVLFRQRHLDRHGVVDELARNGFDVRVFEPALDGQVALVAGQPARRSSTSSRRSAGRASASSSLASDPWSNM